jgi:hypothetical protein
MRGWQVCRNSTLDGRPVAQTVSPRGWMPSTTRANLPARLFEEYDNVTFLVSRLRMPVSFGNLVQ